jgi:hypothetical protein
MRHSRPWLILLLVAVALLSRNLAWAHVGMTHGDGMAVAAALAAPSSPCHDDEAVAAGATPQDQGCRIACDLGTMPPLMTVSVLQARVYAPVRVARVPMPSPAPSRAPDRPPPR